jgi:hypothetical protein
MLGGLLVLALSLSACGSNDSKKSDSQSTRDDAAADTEHQDGHGLGDEGHAPKSAVLSERGVFLVSIEWSEGLEAGTLANQATLTLWDPTLHKVSGTLKSFKLYMPSMGHGSIKTGEMKFVQDLTDPAVWSVSNIYFSMGGGTGSWVVDLEAEVGGQSDKVRVVIPYEVR